MYGGGHGKEQEGPVKQKNLRSPGSRGEERKHRYASEVSTWRVMLTGGRTSEGCSHGRPCLEWWRVKEGPVLSGTSLCFQSPVDREAETLYPSERVGRGRPSHHAAMSDWYQCSS